MKLFHSSRWVEIDVRHMKETPSTLLRCISEKGQYTSKGVLPTFKLELTLVDLILTPSSPLNMPCLSSNPLLNWWQTPGCYNPPPLKESRPEIQDERLLWKGDMLPVSNISDSFRLHSFKHQRDQIGRDNFLYLFFVVNFCQKKFLHWLP